MPWRRLLLYIVFTICVDLTSSGQFTDHSEWLNIDQGGIEGLYGNGISMHDFNRDGLDDITLCTNGNGVRTFVNETDHFTELHLFNDISGDIKQPVWVDYDGDYDADFFCTVYGGGCYLFRNDGDLQFTDVTTTLNLPAENAKCFGAAWADYDRDGDLDVYVANYDFILPAAIENWFFINQGDGTFVESASVLGIDNGYRATFQPAWCDVNLDGWPDLFVINDKYHGNALYLNNAGSFTDVSESYNMNHAMESMSNAWFDFDTDGDFDVYVSNSTQGNKLLRNDVFYFTDVAAETATEVNSVCWNALWFDADHDLKTELHVATNSPVFNNNQNLLFEYSPDGTWIDVSIPNDQRSVLSEAKGDINQDGYWDMIQVAEFPVGTVCWLNNGGSNHFLKFSLKGTAGNKDGIGASVEAFIGGQRQVRTIFAGSGFISQDSKYEIFSLKSQTAVDSIKVKWPSGWTDVYADLPADSTYLFTEGETFQLNLWADQDSICIGSQTTIHASSQGALLWQNNSTESSIVVVAPGWYACTAEHELGFFSIDSIYIQQWSQPEYEVDMTLPQCAHPAGAAIHVITDTSNHFLMNGEEADFFVDSLNTGVHHFSLVDIHGCETHFEINIEIPSPLSTIVEVDTVCYGESIQPSIIPDGGTSPYTIDWNDLDSLHVGAGIHTITVTDALGCTGDFAFEVIQYEELVAEIIHDVNDATLEVQCAGGIPPYQYLWMNSDTSASTQVTDEMQYTCWVTDYAGCIAEVSLILSKAQAIPEMELIVYPVPSRNVLYVISPYNERCAIFSAHGVQVASADLSIGKNEIPINTLAGGFYLLCTSIGNYLFLKE